MADLHGRLRVKLARCGLPLMPPPCAVGLEPGCDCSLERFDTDLSHVLRRTPLYERLFTNACHSCMLMRDLWPTSAYSMQEPR